MKKILLITFTFLCFNSYSQTKKETEDWIRNKFNSYVYEKSPHNESTLKFDKGFLYLLTNYNYYDRVLLQNIDKISIKKFSNNGNLGFTISLFCKNGEKCIEEGTYKNENYAKPQKINSFLTLYLSIEFDNDDLPKRMEKALLHLIKLNNGKASIKKEPF